MLPLQYIRPRQKKSLFGSYLATLTISTEETGDFPTDLIIRFGVTESILDCATVRL